MNKEIEKIALEQAKHLNFDLYNDRLLEPGVAIKAIKLKFVEFMQYLTKSNQVFSIKKNKEGNEVLTVSVESVIYEVGFHLDNEIYYKKIFDN